MTFPLPTTPADVIALALKTANITGVGQAPAPEDISDAFNHLNMMLAQWQRKRYFVYQLVTHSLQATGQTSYSVGPGGDFNMARPAIVNSAYFRQLSSTPQPIDFPLQMLRSQEDYNRISLKNLQSFPRYAFYDPGTPLGTLYVWPVPTSIYTIFISTIQQLQQFATPGDVITLPAEYLDAMMWNLAVRLSVAWGVPTVPEVKSQATVALETIADTNVQVPSLRMPSALRPQRGSTYNVYADSWPNSSP